MLKFDQVEISVNQSVLFKTDLIHIEAGVVALVGRNGSGKSTLFRTIMGLYPQFKGAILLNDKKITEYSRTELAKNIAIVYSNSTLFGNHTGKDVLYLGRLPYQNALAQKTEEDHKSVEKAIQILNLKSLINQRFSTMSDGEKQLIMIGRALVQDTGIIILDEPSAFLDLVNRHKVMEVLRKIAKEGNKLVFFSTHEIDFLPALCASVLLIDQKKLVKLIDKDNFIADIKMSFGIKDAVE